VDIGLPVLSGYEVAERVRAAGGRHILLIALTGYCAPADRQRAYEAGFDAHLPKPADLGELSRLLAAA
jgi:CheY-like chemotaxis protein